MMTDQYEAIVNGIMSTDILPKTSTAVLKALREAHQRGHDDERKRWSELIIKLGGEGYLSTSTAAGIIGACTHDC